MPRNVRNFWLEIGVQGRATNIETGPKSKDGGFAQVIRIRENGSVSDSYIEINGISRYDGINKIIIKKHVSGQEDEIMVLETKR